MKKNALQPADPNVIAVLHHSGGAWRGVIASTRPPRPATLASKEFPAEQTDRIDGWLTENHVGEVLCVLPSAAVICRTCTLPDAAPEQLEQALQLQAEAGLMGIAPPYRVGMAVLPQSPGETSRTGLILAWPPSAQAPIPPTTRPIRYVSDIASLAAILNGQRPAEPLLWLDRSDGSVAIAITHAGGAVLRGTREDAADSAGWEKSVGRIGAETSLSVGHTGSFIESLVQSVRQKAASQRTGEAALFLPPELIPIAAAKIQGLSSDPAWWRQFGLAAGALLARVGPLASLTRMMDFPPVERPSRLGSIAERLSTPRAATMVVIAGILILMFGPLAFAGLRLGILKLRFRDLDAQVAAATATKHQVAIYQELRRQNAWPMTKLLADIATNTPLGIELDMIRLDGGKDFAVSGTAISNDGKTPLQVVAAMQDNLRRDGVFSDVALKIGSGNNLNMFKFDLSANIVHPYTVVKYAAKDDFGAWTHAQRRDGDPMPGGKPGDKTPEKLVDNTGSKASDNPLDKPAGDTASAPTDGTATPRLVKASPSRGSDSTTPPSGRNGTSPSEVALVPDGSSEHPGGRSEAPVTRNADGAAGDMPGSESSGSGPPPSADVPEPVTDEQIRAMQLPELQAQLQKIAKARKYVKGNAEVEGRLKREMDSVLAQIRKVKGS